MVRQQHGCTYTFKKIENRFIHTMCEGELVHRLGCSSDFVKGKDLDELFQPHITSRIKAFYEMAWDGMENIVFDCTLQDITFLANLKPVKVEGKVVEVIATCVDITERKRMEDDVRETNQFLESIINHTSDSIHILDSAGKVVRVNPAFERTFGWSAQEIVGKEIPFVPFYLLSMVKERRSEVLTGEHYSSLETHRLRKDGRLIDVSISLSPIRDSKGTVVGITGISRDVSERKQMEHMLRDIEEKYRIITGSMTDIIAIMDPYGRIMYSSPSHVLVLGYLPEEQEGSLTFDYIHPEDVAENRYLFERMVLSKTPINMDFRFRHADGHWVQFEGKFAPVILSNGEVNSVVLIARDITERKKTEEIIRRSDRLSVISELAAGVAHEVLNPLTSLKGFVQLLQSSDQQSKYSDVMLMELNQIEEIIREFLILAKPQQVIYVPRDVQQLLEGIIDSFEKQIVEDDIQIQTYFEADLPHIHCDERQLKHAFVHILKNANESMQDGGIITVQVKKEEQNKIKVTISDQGCGIPPELVEMLGEPFYRTDCKGTGRGLMVSYKVIENHKGEINITSEQGEGTTVEILLPHSITN